MANSWPIIYGAFCWQKYHSFAASSIHSFYTSLYYSIMPLFVYSCLTPLFLWRFLQAVENAFVPVIKMVFCNIEVSDHFFHHHIFKYKVPSKIACVSEELNYWISPSAKQRQKPCSVPSLVYQQFEYIYVCHNWPVNKAIFNLPIRLKGASRHISGDSFKLLGLKRRVEVTNWG